MKPEDYDQEDKQLRNKFPKYLENKINANTLRFNEMDRQKLR